MSPSTLSALPDVVAKLKLLHPKIPRKLGAPLMVSPRSKRFMLIGAAFDYLLRFELQRRVPHSVARTWAAEQAPRVIQTKSEDATVTRDLLVGSATDLYIPPEEVVRRIQLLLEGAKRSLVSFQNSVQPSAAQLADVAGHAIRLAKVESVVRALRLEPTFEEAKSEDVQELVELLSVVPFDKFMGSKTMLLNPSFGEASKSYVAADADLIVDHTLVDFKTTIKEEIEGKVLDQLLVYLFLARREHRANPSFPAIQRVGLYFSRQGHLWTQDVSSWTDHAEFQAIEKWFFGRAEEVFNPSKS